MYTVEVKSFPAWWLRVQYAIVITSVGKTILFSLLLSFCLSLPILTWMNELSATIIPLLLRVGVYAKYNRFQCPTTVFHYYSFHFPFSLVCMSVEWVWYGNMSRQQKGILVHTRKGKKENCCAVSEWWYRERKREIAVKNRGTGIG